MADLVLALSGRAGDGATTPPLPAAVSVGWRIEPARSRLFFRWKDRPIAYDDAGGILM